MPVALVTGGSAGLGRALVRTLAQDGWSVVTDARGARSLHESLDDLPSVTSVAGDVADPAHRDALRRAVAGHGRLDLLIHNASTLGPLPLRRLRDLTAEELQAVWQTNAAAPLALTAELLPWLHAAEGMVVAITSDAAVEHYETWGAYAASKAALEHFVLTLGAEEGLAAYAVDPGDMRTAMHQDAFPGEDISDRPPPEEVVPALLALARSRVDSGRFRTADLPTPADRADQQEVRA